jgi:hypothetical protein
MNLNLFGNRSARPLCDSIIQVSGKSFFRRPKIQAAPRGNACAGATLSAKARSFFTAAKSHLRRSSSFAIFVAAGAFDMLLK